MNGHPWIDSGSSSNSVWTCRFLGGLFTVKSSKLFHKTKSGWLQATLFTELENERHGCFKSLQMALLSPTCHSRIRASPPPPLTQQDGNLLWSNVVRLRRHSAALSPLPRRPEHRLGLGAGTAQAGGYERCPAQPIPSSSSSSFTLFWFSLLSHEHVPTAEKEAARHLVAPCPHRHGSRVR